jgi:flagellum-specific peptidoglycan hydrolase FlgJ
MSNSNSSLAMRQVWNNGINQVQKTVKNQWVQVGILVAILYIFSQKDMSFHFSMGEKNAYTANILDPGIMYGTPFGTAKQEPIKKTAVVKKEKTTSVSDKKWYEQIKDNSGDIRKRLNLANEATAVGAALSEEEKLLAAKLSNLSIVFNSPEYFKKKNIPQAVVIAKRKTCDNYIEKYSKIAREEAELYNIPASITLAQGLLESNAGESQLAKRENNHFGIKCRSKCIGCRCANYTDDDKYDMFRIFDSAWHSFREHSKLLVGDRYRYLTKLSKSDYKNWARGLKTAGYATDKNYAEKLIRIIEHFKLYRFDK